MYPAWRSVRGRFLSISMVFFLVLSGAAAYTWNKVQLASAGSNEVVNRYYTLQYRLLQPLIIEIRDLETTLYQYAVLLDDATKQLVINQFQEAYAQLLELEHYATRFEMSELSQPLDELKDKLKQTEERANHLLGILETAESRYPAMSTVFSNMLPSHQNMMVAIQIALKEAEEDEEHVEGRALHSRWQQLEHAWMQMAFESRMFIANRSGVFGDPISTMRINYQNHLLWQQRVAENITSLEDYEKRDILGIQQVEALQTVNKASKAYLDAFQDVYQLLNTDEWRSDLPYLKQHIKPAFDAVREASFVLTEHIGQKAKDVVEESQRLADRLLLFILGLTLVSLLLVILAYVMFMRTIHQPIREVARAMNSAGRGEDYTVPRELQIDEITTLINALDGMQEQVANRQIRLESILENISDGIITIDERGRIETFNTAAQKLFGYSREEALGKPVAILMPKHVGQQHQGYMENYKLSGMKHAIDREREELAQRKDGTTFPMSLKVKQMELHGKRLYTAVVSDISERKAAMERLRELAEKDALTGLHNRRYFLEELNRAIKRARRGGASLTLFYIDLDNFKFVNDTLGHMAGDQVLIEVTEMLSTRVRSGDLFARLGGDEFAVLIYDLDDESAARVANSYRQLIAEYQFKYDGNIVDIGCSVGIAAFNESLTNKEDLLARADLACHIAKSTGRNKIHVFDASSQQEAVVMSADMGWARRIKQGIEESGYSLVFQPIVDSISGATVSFEALLRMHGQEGELISPAGFMPAAERFGLIGELDRWVIRKAIDQLSQPPLAHCDCHLSINLSAASVEEPKTLEYIRSVLAESGVEPSRVVFEITETTAITKLSQAVSLLDGLAELGCESALDDFGTGYSSFAYLKELPVNYVKIDGSFVQNIDNDELNRAMVKAMTDVAHAMRKRAVAEFVESAEVADVLREIGVDLQQGYHLGKPELSPAISPHLQSGFSSA